MAGWSLGTVEAILISILAGFSVDYVVHLAHAFSHNYGTVEERIVATFSEMGSPVFSGMCTSVLASLPLFLCNLQFFAKFGTFLCLTIAFSWVRFPSAAPPVARATAHPSRPTSSWWSAATVPCSPPPRLPASLWLLLVLTPHASHLGRSSQTSASWLFWRQLAPRSQAPIRRWASPRKNR